VDDPAPPSPFPPCPWCSAIVDSGDALTCPSCGATLVAGGEGAIPGVTTIDADAVLRGSRVPGPRRNPLLAWISGDFDDEDAAAGHRSVAPPDPAVQREMLRLEIEAATAQLAADAAALAAGEATSRAPLADGPSDGEAEQDQGHDGRTDEDGPASASPVAPDEQADPAAADR
jgi:hypothetical protein